MRLTRNSLPTRNGLLDWDCAEALSIPLIEQQLSHIQATGNLSPHFDSKEDRNDIGPCPIKESTIARLTQKIAQRHNLQQVLRDTRLCLFDGFLLYTPKLETVQEHIDIKFFLQVSYRAAKARREARNGYATIEGFWKDPPGYVDDIVWPNYVKDHEWLFEAGNVEGIMKSDILKTTGIEWYGKEGNKDAVDVELETMLEWIVERLCDKLESIEHRKGDA